MNPLRFALLCNGDLLERWHLQCLDRLATCAALAGVIQTADVQSVSPGTPPFPQRFYAQRADSQAATEVKTRLANVPRFDAGRGQLAFQPGEFDFVLKLGRGPIPAGIESAGRHGVWCFHHECQDHLLPFVREVYDGEDVTEAVLLAFRSPEGAPTILEQGCFRTEKRSYVKNRDRVWEAIAEWPARSCRRLLAGANSNVSRPAGQVPRAPSKPQPHIRLHRFWARIAWRRLGFGWQRLFRHSQWNVGVLPVPVETLLVPGAYADDNIEWFPLHGRAGFLADPFGVLRGSTLHVLCERFDYRSAMGHICAIEYAHHRFLTEPKQAITLPVHVSYPFLIEDAGAIYCIPETCNANEIALFRAVDFPRTWAKAGVLIEQFRGFDPTVFRHDGRWWLTCTQKGPYEDVELWVWYAGNLLGPWTPHARNPVKTDVRSARPGGAPFVHEGALYRPAQDCSKTYGWRIVLHHVMRLTPTEFFEDPVAVLEPSSSSPFPMGRHTLTPVGDVVLIDGHRTVFAWPAFLSFLRIWARALSKSR